MQDRTAALKAELIERMEAEREAHLALLQDFLRIRSVNPPGDMREACAFVRGILDRHGVPYEILSAREDMPNIVGKWRAGGPGRHLVLNGHMDVFPAVEDHLWAAERANGRITARGASDMKTGTLASILTYCLLHPHREALQGELTLTVVSDEQSGGRYGTAYLFEEHAGKVLGDCCLNGEPSGLGNVRFMEKGTLRFSLSAEGAGGHGGYPHQAGNPIRQAMAAVDEIYDAFHMREAEMPAEFRRILDDPATVEAANRLLGNGAADTAKRITVNVGILRGGFKATQIPGACEAHLDMRFPVGPERDRARPRLEAIAARHGCRLEVNEAHSYPASSTDPYGEMATILRDNTRALLGREAPPVCSLGGTDTRYWRWRGIPAVICGPSPLSMGTNDEHVTEDEAMAVLKLHLMCALDYLGRAEAPAG
ncbi:M20/M25/M40 family metallo-hydrolase [Albimonas sp. CAU 1670]|uniref:M20/M25/M40 family metallo-hydrolase n=1 Tax=Albimonas sp. CAU 1670 TaxID=3032599 RepID=UPI0023D9AEF6|nr:M20/M25/M40 family metallo-hydrolase [Albimonas sp. CAU 1670]MDF2230945.1 M20/M25/M40 family metallo-hydrolase [Albimonas sp. CAU 1670]